MKTFVLFSRQMGKTALLMALVSCAHKEGKDVSIVSPNADPAALQKILEMEVPCSPSLYEAQEEFYRSNEVNAWPGAPRYFVPSPWPGGTYKPYGPWYGP